MFLLSAALMLTMQTGEPITIRLSGKRVEDCEMRWNGKPLSIDRALMLAPEWRREGRTIVLSAGGDTAYGCVMQAMGRLDRAGLSVHLETGSAQ